MDKGGYYLLILQVVCLAGVTLSLTCPEMTEETSTCESVRSWLCDYHEWTTAMKEWKDGIEQDCSEEDLGAEWNDLFSCSEPDINDTVKCKNQTAKHCEQDDLNCTVCYCTDGKYKNRQNHFALWRKRQKNWRKTLQLYNEKLRNCGSGSDACSDGEDTTEPTGTPSTEPEMTTPEPCEGLSYGGKCYVLVEPESSVNKSVATDQCRQNGMELADILSAEHYNVTYSYVVSNYVTGFLWTANRYDFSRENMIITSDEDAFEVPEWDDNGVPSETRPQHIHLRIFVPGGFFASLPAFESTPFCVKG